MKLIRNALEHWQDYNRLERPSPREPYPLP